MTNGSTNGPRISGRGIALLLLLLAGLIYLLLREPPDNVRAPAPTPVNENVHEIAP